MANYVATIGVLIVNKETGEYEFTTWGTINVNAMDDDIAFGMAEWMIDALTSGGTEDYPSPCIPSKEGDTYWEQVACGKLFVDTIKQV